MESTLFRYLRNSEGRIIGFNLHSRNWYYHVKDVPDQYLPNSILICWEVVFSQISSDKLHLFSVFQDPIEFCRHFQDTSKLSQCFYESIPGDHPQKPHFDLDLNVSLVPNLEKAEEVKDFLITSIYYVLRSLGIILKLDEDILIYTSHGSEKFSYHIVIDNYMHSNHLEAKAFYDLVIQYMASLQVDIPIPDFSVYKSFQLFRSLGSHKLFPITDHPRIKVFSDVWNYRGVSIQYKYPVVIENDFHKFYIQFISSMVTQCRGMKVISLPSCLMQSVQRKPLSLMDSDFIDISSVLQTCFNNSFFRVYGFPFVLRNQNGRFLELKRMSPSFCPICNRVHESESPYLIVFKDDSRENISKVSVPISDEEEKKLLKKFGFDSTSEKVEINPARVVFYCRRSKEGFFVGCVGG